MRMKRARLMAISALVITIMLTAVVLVEAQYTRRYRPRANRANTARTVAWQRVAPRLAKELDLTEKEAAAVMPKIRQLIVLKSRTLPGLKRLKGLQQNATASTEEVAAGLKRFRNNLANARAKIIRAEKQLVDMKEITPRRELTLTILGILDNGKTIPRVTGAAAKKKEVAKQSEEKKEEPEN
jgi:hypothetical protein